jgi:5-formyltetrahydrofolate cyclo-ligase
LTVARRAVPPDIRAAEATTLASSARTLVAPGQTVCAYVPVGTEPGSVELLDELRALDVHVLLPVVVGRKPLDWAKYDGTLTPGPHNLLQPAGPRLGAEALAAASLILVPALAVDLTGVRLGRGAGHYDRSLVFATPGTELVAVVRDQEFLAQLPADDHDIRMTAVLTPNRGKIEVVHP